MRTTRRGFLGALLAAPLAAAASRLLKAKEPTNPAWAGLIDDHHVDYFPTEEEMGRYIRVPTMPLYSCPVIPLEGMKESWGKDLAGKWYDIGDDGRLMGLDKEWQQTVLQVGSGLGIPPGTLGEDLAGGYRPYKTDMIAQMARDFGRPIARQRYPGDILSKIVKVEPL